jgi:hypothetical protein
MNDERAFSIGGFECILAAFAYESFQAYMALVTLYYLNKIVHEWLFRLSRLSNTESMLGGLHAVIAFSTWDLINCY